MSVIYSCRKLSAASLSLVVCQNFFSKLSDSRKFTYCLRICLVIYFCKHYSIPKTGMSWDKTKTFSPIDNDLLDPYLQFKVDIFKTFFKFLKWSDKNPVCLINNKPHSKGQLDLFLHNRKATAYSLNFNVQKNKITNKIDLVGRIHLFCHLNVVFDGSR